MTADGSNNMQINFSTAKFMETKDVKILTQTKGGTTMPGIQWVPEGRMPWGCRTWSTGAERAPWYRVHQQEQGKGGSTDSSSFLNITYFLFYSCRNSTDLNVVIIFSRLGIRGEDGCSAGFV